MLLRGRFREGVGRLFSPLLLFYDIHFRPTDPEIFLEAHWAPFYSNFEGKRAPKTYNYLIKTSHKVPKNDRRCENFRSAPGAACTVTGYSCNLD